MRVLSLLATIALVSSSEAAILEKTSVAKTTDSDIAFLPRALTVEHQTKRSLRRYGEGDLAPAGEERAGTSENFYGLAENFAHLGFSEVSNARAVAQASKLAARAERAERVERMKAVAQKALPVECSGKWNMSME
ncbi:hypothetical protein ON010_g16775 [Phytophthora cinnamomi]|nr:hypothetical protein ON010_g16775 [Phytophthora cinnamomi]